MVTRVSREFRAGRRALARSVASSLKSQIKGSPWRFAKGVLFRSVRGWFISASLTVQPLDSKTTAVFRFKPVALDPVLWKIVKLPENTKLPLSFRYWGAWKCSTPEWAKMEFADAAEGCEQIAARFLNWCEAQLQQATPHLSHKSFKDFVENYPSQKQGRHFLATLVVTLLLMNRDEEALRELKEAKVARRDGGFGLNGKSFVDMAIEWINSQADKVRPH
jgi:hypothetical protein